ncbi:siderophore ABC transporter substrate-binding protein [Paenibacillus sp. J2TS4]|uniref:siderophore ABC transporter substrate-binding protein n=1 Tax=Paenibacillus sp. J2TS4 TaxID=2807194 RepID=UPI001B236466|nr:siderophore ABC transporter substrate-binding protein [Paenibacillus sp. J2TS4]GIP34872.1 putative ABC transporter solute-binding protein YclQ [Paenibacillus sp. J2TS4]
MKKALLVVFIAMFAAIMAACGSSNSPKEEGTGSGSGSETKQEAEVLTVKHELGETEVKKNPEKVVVFDFGALDTLDKLGVEVTALPKSNVPPYLSKYEDDKYINVGSLKEPDFEKISEINPDLIIISGRQSPMYDELSKLGKTIYVGVDTSRYMESYEENSRLLGEIFGKEAIVEEELAKVKDSIQKLNEKVTSSNKNALIILANDGKVSAYGAGSRFGIIHDVFGFIPVDEDIKVETHGNSISFEYIVDKDPDYLFVVDRGAAVGGESSAKQMVENELVKNTKAYKDGNVVYLDPNYWYLSGGGLISVAEMVKEVEASVK